MLIQPHSKSKSVGEVYSPISYLRLIEELVQAFLFLTLPIFLQSHRIKAVRSVLSRIYGGQNLNQNQKSKRTSDGVISGIRSTKVQQTEAYSGDYLKRIQIQSQTYRSISDGSIIRVRHIEIYQTDFEIRVRRINSYTRQTYRRMSDRFVIGADIQKYIRQSHIEVRCTEIYQTDLRSDSDIPKDIGQI